MWKKLVFTATVFGCFLVVLAIVLHRTSAERRVVRGLRVLLAPWRPATGIDCFEYFAVCDQELGWRNRPDGVYHNLNIVGQPLVTTDADGYRKGGIDGPPVVCLVGDSQTFCGEVGDDETIAAHLSRRLGVPVLNAGVCGYGTLQCKRMLRRCLDRFPSLRVVVYIYCVNDLEENVVADMRYPAKAPWMKRVGDDFVEVEVHDPTVPWGADFSQWKGDRSRIRTPKDMPAFASWARENGGFRCLGQLLREMNGMAKRRGIAFVATCSANSEVRSNELKITGDVVGVPTTHVYEALSGDWEQWISERTDGRLDDHFGPTGTEQFARELADRIEDYLLEGASPPGRQGAGP